MKRHSWGKYLENRIQKLISRVKDRELIDVYIDWFTKQYKTSEGLGEEPNQKKQSYSFKHMETYESKHKPKAEYM